MTWVRMGVLTSLLLVAMTLPVSARSAVIPTEVIPAEDTTGGEPTSGSPASDAPNQVPSSDTAPTDENESSSRLQIAPNTDVWHAGLTRAPTDDTGGVLIQSLMGYDVGVPLMSDDPDKERPLGSSRPNEGTQRPWLACRYAHAPPATIPT